MKKRAFILVIGIIACQITLAQTPTFQRYDTVVVRNILNIKYDNPWAGGFNAVQFSEIDLNFDGKKDLFVFDKQYERKTTFINRGTPGVIKYDHDARYQKSFPTGSIWGLMRDMNCDGKEDFFTTYQGGLSYYKNVSSPGNIQFQLVDKKVQFFRPGWGMLQMWSSPADMPAIDDIDSDGDLDIIAWDQAGSQLAYYKNMSLENHGTCDSVDFQIFNDCWCLIIEPSINSVPTLGNFGCPTIANWESSVPAPPKGTNPKGGKHIGGTVLTLDMDADTAKDLVISDVVSHHLYYLNNTGTKDSAVCGGIDTLFPQNFSSTLPVSFEKFPAAFYVDVDNDSVKDLLASPFQLLSVGAGNFAENERSAWLFKNNGATNNPNFSYTTNQFLQNSMLEHGEGCHPQFFDYNNDSLMDMVVGNYGYYNGTPYYDSKLALYENVGTKFIPEFKLITKDFAGLNSINLDITNGTHARGLYPTFGDMDGDGDKDMFVGDSEGYIHYFQNTAPIGANANFVLDSARFGAIDVDEFAAPFIVDLNRDGKMDLVIGERYGNINYYENTSTTYPNFIYQTDTLGKFNTKGPWFIGFATPYVHDNAGSYEMYVGSIAGGIYYCTNIDGNLTGAFTVHTDTLDDIWEGGRTAPTGTDLDSDGLLDLAIGNYCGGIGLHKQYLITGEAETEVTLQDFEAKVYPNPNHGILRIGLERGFSFADLEVHNIYGQTVHQTRVKHKELINLSQFKSGTYFFVFKSLDGSRQHVEKVMVLGN